MGEITGIEWTDCTFNPWIGCTAISPACDHCYAKTLVERWGGDFLVRRQTSDANWAKPLAWNRKAEKSGKRMKVFCASLADVFDNQVQDEWREKLFKLIRITPMLDWQLLTKRPQNIAKMLPGDWGMGYPNVWLGTTAEDAHHYRQRWQHIRSVPAAMRFLSYEPALGPLGEIELFLPGSPDWIICGGESGPGARPMHPDWEQSIREQCALADVPYFRKQWGEFVSEVSARYEKEPALWLNLDGRCATEAEAIADGGTWKGMFRVGKKASGSLLNGVEHKAFPV